MPSKSNQLNQDRLRTYENCSHSDVLAGKRMTFSPTFVRAALAWCAKKQVSAHCLPRDSKEIIEFVHAVGWNVTDPDTFNILGKKLLDWVSRWVTNKNLSPAMIETKKDPNQRMMADWEGVWAAYTTDWIDPDFQLTFVLGKTSPYPTKGANSSPRASVLRPWKSAAALVEAAANLLGHQAEAGPSLVVEVSEQVDVGADSEQVDDGADSMEVNVSEESQQEDISEAEQEYVSDESEQQDADGTIVAEKPVIPQKIFAIPTTKVHSKPAIAATNVYSKPTTPATKVHGKPAIPATKVYSKPAMPTTKVHSKPTTPDIPVDLFATVVADPVFMDWFMDTSTTALTPDQARDFPYVATHPVFKSWWQSELKAKHHNEIAAVDKISTKKKTHKPVVVAVGKKNKVRFFSPSPARSVDRGRTSKRV